MMVAQQLYEGINLGSGAQGLITYMRTDSTRISPVWHKTRLLNLSQNALVLSIQNMAAR